MLDIFSFQTPAAFFDGAERNNSCGCGVFVVIDDSLHYSLSWHGEFGSNSLAEARAKMEPILRVARILCLPRHPVYFNLR